MIELPEYKKWSQWKEERFPDYEIDEEKMIINPTMSAPKLNYN